MSRRKGDSNSIIAMSRIIYTFLLFSLLSLIVSTSATFHHGKKMARQFTKAHNTARLSMGLPPVTWNRTLARYARRWASQRAGDCALIHSPNSPYGENLFWSLRGHWTPREVVKLWADEGIYYDPKTNECVDGRVCGHYTQVIWKNTKQIGCGKNECVGNRGYIYVCSYNPPGNFYSQTPFGEKVINSIIDPPDL